MRYILLAVLFISATANAQWKTFKLSPRGDTLNRIDLNGLKQGPWVVHTDDLRGERGFDEQGYFWNDKKEGRWTRFSLDGDVIAKENYRWGQKDGRNEYFNYQGEPIREEFWRAIDPQNPYDTVKVFDVNDQTKVLKTIVVRVESATVKHGTWRYFDPQTGKIEKTEKWVMDKLKTKDDEQAAIAANDDLAPIDVTKSDPKKTEAKKTVAKPQVVLDFEKKNAGKKKIKVRDGSTGH
ncbi:MAG: toxin-antitoxin system YwqK family antitoxin [Candidatus Dadabacteria bacterium]